MSLTRNRYYLGLLITLSILVLSLIHNTAETEENVLKFFQIYLIVLIIMAFFYEQKNTKHVNEDVLTAMLFFAMFSLLLFVILEYSLISFYFVGLSLLLLFIYVMSYSYFHVTILFIFLLCISFIFFFELVFLVLLAAFILLCIYICDYLKLFAKGSWFKD
ncbi:MAG: hypothetical protein ACMXYF_03480 [Candidatus Woesearchaeota archaeon]